MFFFDPPLAFWITGVFGLAGLATWPSLLAAFATLLAASGGVPVLLMGLIAGAWVDRLRRRPLMIAADLARALVLLLIPLGAIFGFLSIGLLYAAVILTSIFTVFFESAYQAYLPSLVTRAHLVEGNSKLALSGSLAEVLGPGLAGFLVQALTAPIAILVDSLSFVVSAVSLTIIRHTEAPPAIQHERQPIGHEMVEGVRTIWHDPIPVSYTHLRAHETVLDLVCSLLLEKKKTRTLHTSTLQNNYI